MPYQTPERVLESLGLEVVFVEHYADVPEHGDRGGARKDRVYICGPLQSGIPFAGHDLKAIQEMTEGTRGKWVGAYRGLSCIGTEAEVMAHLTKHHAALLS